MLSVYSDVLHYLSTGRAAKSPTLLSSQINDIQSWSGADWVSEETRTAPWKLSVQLQDLGQLRSGQQRTTPRYIYLRQIFKLIHFLLFCPFYLSVGITFFCCMFCSFVKILPILLWCYNKMCFISFIYEYWRVSYFHCFHCYNNQLFIKIENR